MLRALFYPAVLTGVFCAGFVVVVDSVTDMPEPGQLIVFSFISGFCGSIFARLVLGKGERK